jgi:glycosyltransferase involved in cell wall biosynthesis
LDHSLRVLHIINSLDPRQGGTVECVRQVGSAVASKGHTVEVAVCGDVPEHEWLPSFPISAHPLGPAFGKYAYTPRLRGWLREHGKNFDVWIINGLWQYQGLGASRIARELGIPYFVYAHGMLDPWNRRASPAKYVKKLLYWIVAEHLTLEHAVAVLFTSQEESILARSYFPWHRWKELVVGNGVSEPPVLASDHKTKFRLAHSIPEGKKVMLFLSRIHPKKGIEILLKAFASLPSTRAHTILVIAGDGDEGYIDSLKRLSHTLGLDEVVRWVGPLYNEQKWEAFSVADLFVLPSHQENFGIVVAEALAMGKPICTTTGVNIHRYIEDYDAGIICGDNEHDLKAALSRWEGITSSEAADLGRNARRCFDEQFRVARASDVLIEAMQKAVADARGARSATP